MIFLEITRKETGQDGTLGVMTINKRLFCVTLEPPKRENQQDISCIPTGQYLCRRYDSDSFGVPCLRVLDVPGRENVSIHYGNRVKDTAGCIIVGTFPGLLHGDRAVLRSKPILQDLMSEIKDICHLTIKEDF